jgi:hypothetical protein
VTKLVGLAIVAVASVAHAGARPYAFTQGTDALSTNEIELENWFTALNPGGHGASNVAWNWWLGPVAGITDHLEVGLFAIFDESALTTSGMSMDSLRLQTTFMPFDKGDLPIDVRIRGELGVPMHYADGGGSYTGWVSVIASKQLGPVDLTANVGVWAARGKYAEMPGAYDTDNIGYFNYALGASYAVGNHLRVGGEAYGNERFSSMWTGHYVGPALAYGAGRFWLSASYLFADNAQTAARMNQVGRLVLGFTL